MTIESKCQEAKTSCRKDGIMHHSEFTVFLASVCARDVITCVYQLQLMGTEQYGFNDATTTASRKSVQHKTIAVRSGGTPLLRCVHTCAEMAFSTGS